MIKPIIACVNPYETVKQYEAAGWQTDFVQPPESGDPLVGMSLYGNEVLLGVTKGYVAEGDIPYIGCGIELYLTVPLEALECVHENHKGLYPSEIRSEPWGTIFTVTIEKQKYMIAGI